MYAMHCIPCVYVLFSDFKGVLFSSAKSFCRNKKLSMHEKFVFNANLAIVMFMGNSFRYTKHSSCLVKLQHLYYITYLPK